MEIFAYGEDALTLWAIKNRLDQILGRLEDTTPPSECKIFYRPSFGRRGGPHRSEFGEFDFIIIAQNRLYLGESKWDGSSEIKKGDIELREEQTLRHHIFKCYVECWLLSNDITWKEFSEKVETCFNENRIKKLVASRKSKLSHNIETILNVIKGHYKALPEIKNVLLFFYKEIEPKHCPKDFQLITIDYSKDAINNFMRLDEQEI